MNIRHGSLEGEKGPGVVIDLDAREVLVAIHAYLLSHQVYLRGPFVVEVNGSSLKSAQVCVFPEGLVAFDKVIMRGDGTKDE